MPARGELVAAYNPDEGEDGLRSALADADGRYRIEGLPPGDYAVLPLGQTVIPTRGFVTDAGWSVRGLPSPFDIYPFDVTVRAGALAQRDIDLAREELGRIDGTVAAALVPEAFGERDILYGMVIGGIPRTGSSFGGFAPLGPEGFELENLLPGTYRIYRWDAESSSLLAGTEVEVGRGQPARRVYLSPPTARLLVPVEGSAAGRLGEVRVASVERQAADREATRSAGVAGPRWGGYRTEVAAEGIRITGLPPGLVEVELACQGHRTTRSARVELFSDTESVAPPVTFVPGVEADGEEEDSSR